MVGKERIIGTTLNMDKLSIIINMIIITYSCNEIAFFLEIYNDRRIKTSPWCLKTPKSLSAKRIKSYSTLHKNPYWSIRFTLQFLELCSVCVSIYFHYPQCGDKKSFQSHNVGTHFPFGGKKLVSQR